MLLLCTYVNFVCFGWCVIQKNIRGILSCQVIYKISNFTLLFSNNAHYTIPFQINKLHSIRIQLIIISTTRVYMSFSISSDCIPWYAYDTRCKSFLIGLPAAWSSISIDYFMYISQFIPSCCLQDCQVIIYDIRASLVMKIASI